MPCFSTPSAFSALKTLDNFIDCFVLIKAGIMHTDKNIYKINFIKSLKYRFDDADSWLASQITNLSTEFVKQEHMSTFAEKLAGLLRGHPRFGKIDRVCLAQSLAPVNALLVVSSHCSLRVEHNLMSEGYRCFVDPQGSLFQLKPGQMRVYGSTDKILATYNAQRRPVQRSMRLIHEMGFKSGMCLPIFFLGNIRGFLFLNSLEEQFFDGFESEGYALFSLMKMLAKVCLAVHTDARSVMRPREFAGEWQYSSRVFSPEKFTLHLQAMLFATTGKHLTIQVESSVESALLISPSLVALVLSSAIVELTDVAHHSNIVVFFERRGQSVCVRFQHLLDLGDVVVRHAAERASERLAREASAVGMEFAFDQFFATLTFPLDLAYDADPSVLYSV